MKDKSANDTPQRKRRKSVSKRKRTNSGRSTSGRESQETILTTHEDEEENAAANKSAGGSPKSKKRKDNCHDEFVPIKLENTASQDEYSSIEESLLFEVEKREVFKTPTKDLRPADAVKEEDYELQKLVCSPRGSSASKSSMTKTRSSGRKTRMQTPNKNSLSHKKRQLTNEKDTPNKRERKISLASDYDQLSDTVKSELYNVTNFNELEPIDMIHDLDTVMHFEDIEVNQENAMLPNGGKITEKVDTADISNDPCEDPLYIPEKDERQKITSKKPRKARYLTKKLHAIKYIKLGKPSKKSIAKRKNTRMCVKAKDQVESIKIKSELKSEKSFSLSDEVEEALQHLQIKLIHEVPPQHMIEKSGGSSLLSFNEKQLFETYGPLRKGVYSPNEDDTIKQNWESFCKVHRWDPQDVQPFLYMRHGNKYYIKSVEDRHKFVQFIAHGLPWRTLYSVYQRFRKLYEKQDKTYKRYTKAEDKKILSYIEHDADENTVNKKFSDLAKLLKRSRQSIWMRYHRLQKLRTPAKNSSTIVWTKTLIADFIRELINVTLSEDIAELKDATIPKPVWLKLEEKLGIDEDVVKTFWLHQLHMQLFCPHKIYLNDIKIKLIEYIYGKGISSTRAIIWPNVAKYFEGMTSVFLCKIFFHLVREVTVKKPNLEFTNIIEHLYQEKIPEIREEPTDKYLPRLKYANESVEFIEEQTDDHTDIE